MNLTRMDLADAGSPDKLVQTILQLEPDLPIPIPIEELCRQLDISDIEPLTTHGYEGALITDAEKSIGSILFNSESPYQRRRFTIAHELGHFLIPSHTLPDEGKFLCSRDDMNVLSMKESDRRKRMEAEANRFAALILMPPTHFRKDVERQRDADINQIIKLAERYKTSKEATARWYVQFRRESCAIIVGHRNKVLRHYKKVGFPFIEPSWGDPMPDLSLAGKYDGNQGAISDWHEVNPSAWISVDRGRPAPELFEQVHAQRDGYSLTLLVLSQRDYDEEDEDRDIERAWYKPRFAYGR